MQRIRKIRIYLMWALVLLILVLPLLIYLYLFGLDIFATSEGWAKFSASVSGIYSPVIAFFAFAILIRQYSAQKSIDKHQFDQTHISQSRDDVFFYLGELNSLLSERQGDRLSVREELESVFGEISSNALKESSVIQFGKEFYRDHHKIVGHWGAIYAVLTGLSAAQEYPYEYNFTALQQRIVSVLSWRTCVALDQFHFCAFNKKGVANYYFWDEAKP